MAHVTLAVFSNTMITTMAIVVDIIPDTQPTSASFRNQTQS